MVATITQETRITLSRGEAVALGSLETWLVECRHGEVWLTVDGESRDVILGSGSAWTVDSDGPVVVSAFAPSSLSLRAPGRPSLLARLRGLLAGLPGHLSPPLFPNPSIH